MTTLDGKIVLVTGAGGGFGRELILQLLRAGSYLVLTDRDLALLHATTSEVAAAAGPVPGRILGFVAADLTTATGCDALYAQATALAPAIDILINNAGVGASGYFEAMPDPALEALIMLNAVAPMRLTARVLPDMLARGAGHIVNVSSVAGLVGAAGLTAYSTSKWALRGFGEALGNEVGSLGIRVTTVYPFFARTPILDAPQYGGERRTLPGWMLYEPRFVVAALLEGVRRDRRNVYPGALPRMLDAIQRFAPGLMPRLTRRLGGRR
jgi:short-subunit dehydrogenase